jgi:hypothetical protein
MFNSPADHAWDRSDRPKAFDESGRSGDERGSLPAVQALAYIDAANMGLPAGERPFARKYGDEA